MNEQARALEQIARVLETMRNDNMGNDSWNHMISSFQNEPKAEALERIADALEKRNSSDE